MDGRPTRRLAKPTWPAAPHQPREARGAVPAHGARRTLRDLNVTAVLPPIVLGGIATVVLDARSWWHAAVLSLGVLAAVVAFVQWAAGRLLRVAVPCLAVAGAVWVFGVHEADSASAVFGIAVVGSHVVPQLPSRRGAAAVALTAFVAAVGASRLWVTQGDVRAELIEYLLLPTGLTVVITGLMFPNKRFYDVVADLEEARERDAELAVIRERFRFASDLHDIQGHTLHVVKLKVALAQKLLRTDTDRVEEELREIYGLVTDTISQTKDLADGQRTLNLSAELENAKNLFEAAGIRVSVLREHTTDPRVSELLGQVLRETTTNILRHAQASQVRITLARHGITIVNDGVREKAPPRLRGLSALRSRVENDGGELVVELQDDRFLTAATFEPAATDRLDPTRSGA